MPSGCAALPAKKTTDAEGPCMRLAQSYHAFDGSAPAKAEISGLMKMLADAGRIASGRLFAYDVAHVLARGQVARHGLLEAALAGVGHAHADRSASGARLIAGSRRSTLPKLVRQRAGSRGFIRPAGNERLVTAAREHAALRGFHLLTSHRGRRSRTWPRARRASRRRAPPAPRGRSP